MSWLFKVLGADGINQLGVDANFKAARVSQRPVESQAWLSVASRSGALTGLAANVAIFSFRNLSANALIVRRVGVGFLTTTAFTAAQEVAFGLKFARAFTGSDSSGTAIALTGSNCKQRSSLASLTSVDCRISAAAALTAGTKTLDTNDLGVVGFYSNAAGASLSPSLNNLLSHDEGDYPLVLAQNEGFNIMSLVALGAAGVGVAYVNMEVAEATGY
jgi:hypothetical protein